MFENGKNCWFARINQLYNTAGLPIKFNMSGSGNSKAHVNEIMTQLSDQFIQETGSVESMPLKEERII